MVKYVTLGHLAKWLERATFLILGAAFYRVLVMAPPVSQDEPAANVLVKDTINVKGRFESVDYDNEVRDQTIHLKKAMLPEYDEHSAGLDDASDMGRSDDVDQEHHQQTGEIKTILFWNSFFQQDSYGLGGFGQGPFLRGGCRVNTCQTTNDKALIDSADAVVIHGGYGVNHRETPLPVRKDPKQIYVFFEFEPPLLKRFGFTNLNNMINLTMTYLDHPDTDIYSPYGIIKPRNSHEKYHKYFRGKPLTKESLRKKTKQVAWMVSDCHPASKRMEYAKELSKYINVDIYGKCGMDICPHGSRNCTDLIENNYKFYLAFENSMCDDYITEKTFKMMYQHNLIPVVLGKANYSRHVPPNSVIDVRDHKGPRQLANYLLQLDKHDDMYMKYFEWKQHMSVQTSPRIDGFCKLCETLHNTNYQYKKNFKVDNYWNAENSCVREEAELNVIHLK